MLKINGVVFTDIILPKYYLNTVFPAVFQAVYATDHFQVGVLLPLAVLSCFGLQVLLEPVSKRHRSLVVLAAVALVAFEYYQVPISQVVSDQELAFNEWLKSESNRGDIRLINLPMGRRSSKLYGFYQTINGYPHAEGVAMRTPSESYDYVRQNTLLLNWRKRKNIECKPENFDRYPSCHRPTAQRRLLSCDSPPPRTQR